MPTLVGSLNVAIPYDVDVPRIFENGCKGKDWTPCEIKQPGDRLCREQVSGDSIHLRFTRSGDVIYVDTDPTNKDFEYKFQMNSDYNSLFINDRGTWVHHTYLASPDQLPKGMTGEGGLELNERAFKNCLYVTTGWLYKFDEVGRFFDLYDGAYEYLKDQEHNAKASAIEAPIVSIYGD